MPRSYASDLLANDLGLEGGRLTEYPTRPERRRSDLLMIILATCATTAVLFNALAMQNGRRGALLPSLASLQSQAPKPVPAPASPSVPASTPAPAATDDTPAAPITLAPAIPLPPVKPPVPPRPAPAAVATPAPPAAAQPVSLQPASAAVRPPADLAVSPRVMEIQKALASIGYGPVPIDGRFGTSTQQAIQRFERDRRLPVTGEVNDRLVKELNAVAGFSIR